MNCTALFADCLPFEQTRTLSTLSNTTTSDIFSDFIKTDLAVGAPYEGRGSVYIFHGSKTGLVGAPSQRIYAADVGVSPTQLRTFGYSIAAGVDVDDNNYPDMVVGAYDAGQIVVFRARPVVNVKATLINLDGEIDPKLTTCRFDGSRTPNNCFRLKACFSFTSKLRSVSSSFM